MGILLVSVVLCLLLVAYGTGASRSYQMSQESDQDEFHVNATSSIQGLIGQVSPHADSSADPTYFAIHGAEMTPDGYYGFIGTLDVYGFSLRHGQGSAAGVWMADSGDGSRSSAKEIAIGWDVVPSVYGDSRTHLFTLWTDDGYLKTGCLNMKCSGFQPEKGAAIAPGDIIEHVTFPKQLRKQNINIKIFKDGASGDWLVHCGINRDPELIGRFPRSLFTGGFEDKAAAVRFGGMVTAPVADPAPMGSGYVPKDARSAASVSNIQLIDQNGHSWPLTRDLTKFESKPDAYTVSPVVNGQFFYGGPQQPMVLYNARANFTYV